MKMENGGHMYFLIKKGGYFLPSGVLFYWLAFFTFSNI
jgi:hypothetical protein